MDYPESDMVITERAALVGWWMAEGARMNVVEIAEHVGLGKRSVYYMMNKIARSLPIALDEHGRWHRIDKHKQSTLTKRVVQVR